MKITRRIFKVKFLKRLFEEMKIELFEEILR